MSAKASTGGLAKEQFVRLFSEAFGPENAVYLYSQYSFEDIGNNSRYVDFLLEHDARRVAIEIAEEGGRERLSEDELADLLLRANSMTHKGWEVYRWAGNQLKRDPEGVKEQLQLFLGRRPRFQEIADFLPAQKGKSLDGAGLELRAHQQKALDALAEMRRRKETIALLYHATGTGKTVTAVMDAMRCGGRTLFLAHTKELVEQAAGTFQRLWPEASVGLFAEGERELETHVVCGSIQSVSQNLELFSRTAFDYLIIDEAHHATAESYRRVLAYFRPSFTLGLTATPERADDRSILEIFRRTAHRLDIRTAVELGELVSIRCIRVRTNIDLSEVRFNAVVYNQRDLEVRLFVPERNQLIVDTWEQYCQGKRTVVFCVSVRHARQMAELFQARGFEAAAVSGGMSRAEREDFQEKFRGGAISILCACDLLNEGWDCPEVEVLFMARPTMSRVLYTQQLGRGMRKAPGKKFLMVFDFVDNAGRFNCPYSLHRLFRIPKYWPGGYVAAPAEEMEADRRLMERRKKPEALLDWPIEAMDYELVELFDWQEQAEGMLSQMELVRQVSAQEETIERKIRSGELKADLEVPLSGRTMRWFRPETVRESAERFGWELIDDRNRKDHFMKMVRTMTMSYSYKPVLLKGILQYADETGAVKLRDLVAYFRAFYEDRRARGLVVEKGGIYAKGSYTDQEVERNILQFPFHRFEQMQMMRHTKTLGLLQMEETVWSALTEEEKEEIRGICDRKLEEYYRRLSPA